MSKIKIEDFVFLTSEIKNLEEVKIMPTGKVETTKGNFVVDEESVKQMQENFKKRGIDIVIDYEHQSLGDKKALAGGWIKDFYIKENYVVAKVEWTKQAKEEIESKQYKYLSPTIYLKNGKPVRLHSVALTNTPAIDKFPALRLKNDEFERGNKMEKILESLGMDSNSTEEEILKKIEELKNNSELKTKQEEDISMNKETSKILELKEDASIEEINKKILELKENSVSKEEFLSLKQEFEKKELNQTLDNAIKLGKITPAQRESFEKLALSDREVFDEILKNQKITSPLAISYSEQLTADGKKLIEEEDMKVCKGLGLSEEDYKKYYRKDDE